MHIEISSRSEPRVKQALTRRAELMRMNTREMPTNWMDEMRSAEITIAAAVAHAVLAQRL